MVYVSFITITVYGGCVVVLTVTGYLKRLTIVFDLLLDEAADGSGGVDSENELCKICMDAIIDCVLLECGHMVTCTSCGRRLHECPICRNFVVRVVHTFKA